MLIYIQVSAQPAINLVTSLIAKSFLKSQLRASQNDKIAAHRIRFRSGKLARFVNKPFSMVVYICIIYFSPSANSAVSLLQRCFGIVVFSANPSQRDAFTRLNQTTFGKADDRARGRFTISISVCSVRSSRRDYCSMLNVLASASRLLWFVDLAKEIATTDMQVIVYRNRI